MLTKKGERFVVIRETILEVNKSEVDDVNNLKVFYYNPETGEWENVGGEYDGEGYVVTETDHFSTYAVFNEAAETPNGEQPTQSEDDDTNEPTDEEPTGNTDSTQEDQSAGESIKNNNNNGNSSNNTNNTNNTTTNTNNELPNTATNMYNVLLAGIAFMMAGTAAAFLMGRRKKVNA